MICSTQRSGSFLLCRQLINAGIGVPQEYFNDLHTETLSRRWRVFPLDDLSYVHELLARRTTPNGIWATKIQWLQFREHRRRLEDLLSSRSTTCIFLYRTDLVAQAVSLHVSILTGVWGFDGVATTAGRPDVAIDDLRHVARCARTIVRQNRKWRAFFAQRSIAPLVMTYEALAEDQPAAVRRIATRLRLGPGAFRVPPTEERDERLSAELEVTKRTLIMRLRSKGPIARWALARTAPR